jgi:hypothetical protein
MGITKSPTLPHTGRGTSTKSFMEAGTGSRPGTASKHKIESSAPKNARTLGRSGKP